VLIPSRLPHSPQRRANTVGLVIERQRRPASATASSGTARPAAISSYEEFFELTDIEKQFPPVFERSMRNRERRTCTRCGTVMERAG